MKAIIVDPSTSARNVFSSLLGRYDIEVCETSSGLSALRLMDNASFDLLLFASELEDMEGMEFYNQCRLSHATHVPINLLVTGSHHKKLFKQAIEAEVTACFSKLDLPSLEQFIVTLTEYSHIKHQGHILLVEDSLSATMLYSGALSKLGFTFDHCTHANISHIRVK